jgi:hypothetical protein
LTAQSTVLKERSRSDVVMKTLSRSQLHVCDVSFKSEGKAES